MHIIKNKEHSRVANSIFHQAMSYKMQNFASAKRYQILLSDLADLCHICMIYSLNCLVIIQLGQKLTISVHTSGNWL